MTIYNDKWFAFDQVAIHLCKNLGGSGNICRWTLLDGKW